MTGSFDQTQISGNEWGHLYAGRVYDPFQQSVNITAPRTQLLDLSDFEEQMIRFEADHKTLISEVQKYYVLPTDNSVEYFFRRYRSLPQLLIEAVPHLQRFVSDAILSLRPTTDEYGWQTLYVDILWRGQARDVIKAIDQFEDAWWLAHSSSASGSLTFTYRLV